MTVSVMSTRPNS